MRNYMEEAKLRSLINSGVVTDGDIENYLQGVEFDKWCEGKDLDETVEVSIGVIDIDGSESVQVGTHLVNVYTPIDVTAQVAQWKKQNYSILRKSAYPEVAEFVDAHIKNDDVALKAYMDKCLAVKVKYPK